MKYEKTQSQEEKNQLIKKMTKKLDNYIQKMKKEVKISKKIIDIGQQAKKELETKF